MTELTIDGIQLTFDDSWLVTKWDDSPWYRDGIERLKGKLNGNAEGTKAVDVVGIRDEIPYLFEVKDFRGFAIKNKARQVQELPLEIGLKARDTIAGLVGLVSRDREGELPRRWVHAVKHHGRAVHVVAFLAEDAARPGEAAHKRAARESERLNRVKQFLTWLTPRVWVTDPLRNPPIPGLTAASLAGGGAARGFRS
jgi:hypothetical protein